MLTIPYTARIFVALEPTDLRKGFDGLMAIVENIIQQDPLSGHLFVFRNQRRDRIKILWWDRDGLAIFYKRLEQGTYQFPSDQNLLPNATQHQPVERGEIRPEQLALLLQGIDLKSVVRRKRYQRPVTANDPGSTVSSPPSR